MQCTGGRHHCIVSANNRICSDGLNDVGSIGSIYCRSKKQLTLIRYPQSSQHPMIISVPISDILLAISLIHDGASLIRLLDPVLPDAMNSCPEWSDLIVPLWQIYRLQRNWRGIVEPNGREG